MRPDQWACKPDTAVLPRARVTRQGGVVDFAACWRVICPPRLGRPATGLAVSRALGDIDFKEPDR